MPGLAHFLKKIKEILSTSDPTHLPRNVVLRAFSRILRLPPSRLLRHVRTRTDGPQRSDVLRAAARSDPEQRARISE